MPPILSRLVSGNPFRGLVSELPLLLALGLVPLVFDMRCADPTEAPKLALLLLAAGLSLGPIRTPSLALKALWGLLLVGFVSALVNGPEQGWTHLLTLAGSLLLANQPRGRYWVLFLLTGWGCSVAYSWIQRAGLDWAPWSHPELSRLRTIAGLGNPNYLALFLAAGLPLLQLVPQLPKALAWLAACLGTVTMLATGTRGAALALLIVVGLSSLRCGRQHPKFFLAIWLLMATSWGLAWQVQTQAATSFRGQWTRLQGGNDQSISARLGLFQSALRQGSEHPLTGVGPGNFGDFYLLERPPESETLRALPRRPENPHNQTLQILAETGLPGLLCWLTYLFQVAWHYWRHPSPKAAAWAILIVAGASNSYPLSIWPMLVALTPTPNESGSASLGRLWPLGLTLAVLAGGAGWMTQRAFWWDDELTILESQKLVAPASRIEHLLRTEKLCPPWYRDELWRRMSQAYAQQQRLAQAETYARLRTLRRPANAYAWQALAALLESGSQWAEAAQAWQRCHQLDPKNPGVLYFWARALVQLGKLDEAAEKIERSLEIYSKSRQGFQLRAQIRIEQGQSWEGYWDWVRGFEPTSPAKTT